MTTPPWLLHQHPQHPVGPWIDASAYPHLRAVLASAGSSRAAVLVSDALPLGAPVVEVPPQITLTFVGRGRLLVGNRQLVLSGPVEGPPQTLFVLQPGGTVRRSPDGLLTEVLPEWFGARGGHNEQLVATGASPPGPDDTAALQRAIDVFAGELEAQGGTVRLRPTGYRTTGPLTLRDNVALIGAGTRRFSLQGTLIRHDPPTPGPALVANQQRPELVYSNVRLAHLAIVGTAGISTVGLHLDRCRGMLTDVAIRGFDVVGLQVNYGIHTLYERVRVAHCGTGLRIDGLDGIAVSGTASTATTWRITVQLLPELPPPHAVVIDVPVAVGHTAAQTAEALATALRGALPDEVQIHRRPHSGLDEVVLSGALTGVTLTGAIDPTQSGSQTEGPSTTQSFSACSFHGCSTGVVVDRSTSVVFRDSTTFESNLGNAVEIDGSQAAFYDCHWENNAGHYLMAGTRRQVPSITVRSPLVLGSAGVGSPNVIFDVFHLDEVLWARLEVHDIPGGLRASLLRTTERTGRVWFAGPDRSVATLISNGPRQDSMAYAVGEVHTVTLANGRQARFVCIETGITAAAQPPEYVWNASNVADGSAVFRMAEPLCVHNASQVYVLGQPGQSPSTRLATVTANRVRLQYGDAAGTWLMGSGYNQTPHELYLREQSSHGDAHLLTARSLGAGTAAGHMVFGGPSAEVSLTNPIRFAKRVETAHGVEIHEGTGAPFLQLEGGGGNVQPVGAGREVAAWAKVQVDGTEYWLPLYGAP